MEATEKLECIGDSRFGRDRIVWIELRDGITVSFEARLEHMSTPVFVEVKYPDGITGKITIK